jgi:hypothetical protein
VSANYLPERLGGPEKELVAGVTYAFGRGFTASLFHQ